MHESRRLGQYPEGDLDAQFEARPRVERAFPSRGAGGTPVKSRISAWRISFCATCGRARRRESAVQLERSTGPVAAQSYDLAVYDETFVAPPKALVFHPDRTRQFVEKTLSRHPDLGIPLAKSFLPFRRPFVHQVIAKTARENALFSLATALPDVIPSVIELPWAIAEFASDTAFLTMNQVRMAFIIAAASDREAGLYTSKIRNRHRHRQRFRLACASPAARRQDSFRRWPDRQSGGRLRRDQGSRIVARPVIRDRIHLLARGARSSLCRRLPSGQKEWPSGFWAWCVPISPPNTARNRLHPTPPRRLPSFVKI